MTGISEYLERLVGGQDLNMEQAGAILDIIFDGQVPEPQIGAFLTAMRMKGVTAEELAGFAGSLRSHAVKVPVQNDAMVDTCGTGGGAIKTCNISTAAAIVAAGAGAYVAKHGNRGITSKCGSADVLEALGVNINAGPEVVSRCIREAHIGFMFAPNFHPAMKYVQPVRKSLGFRTIFNMLGPLANPAEVKRQVLGVADEGLMEVMAEALRLLGCRRAMVVHSNGLDEISTTAVTKILELNEGRICRSELDAKKLGFREARIEQLQVADAGTSAKVLRDILCGREQGARRDIVVLNAAAAIVVSGLADDFAAGVKTAEKSINSGTAAARLEKLIGLSKE